MNTNNHEYFGIDPAVPPLVPSLKQQTLHQIFVKHQNLVLIRPDSLCQIRLWIYSLFTTLTAQNEIIPQPQRSTRQQSFITTFPTSSNSNSNNNNPHPLSTPKMSQIIYFIQRKHKTKCPTCGEDSKDFDEDRYACSNPKDITNYHLHDGGEGQEESTCYFRIVKSCKKCADSLKELEDAERLQSIARSALAQEEKLSASGGNPSW